MINPRIEKVKAEIEKMKARITELTAKLRELEREKIRLENERIVALVRSEKISDAELSALMRARRRPEAAEEIAEHKTTGTEEEGNARRDEY
jgi:hypothetical protein